MLATCRRWLGAGQLRLVELLGAISLATDLGTGQPPFHGVRTSVLAVAVTRELGLDDAAVAEVQQVALLQFVGCAADTWQTARMTGGDDLAFLAAMAPAAMGAKAEMARSLVGAVGAGRPALRRAALAAGALSDPGGARRSLSAHCEVAAMLAGRLGTGPAVRQALAHGYERWDGAGFPDGLAGEAVPLAVRVAVVARDAELWWRAGPEPMTQVLRARRGRAYDPAVAGACLAVAAGVLGGLDQADAWQAMLAASPGGGQIAAGELDHALEAVADFADLKSPWTRGHSPRVAALAAAAAHGAGMTAREVTRLRRAALLHDLGRVGVPNGIWDRAGTLGVADWERVRMHPYLTESTLAESARRWRTWAGSAVPITNGLTVPDTTAAPGTWGQPKGCWPPPMWSRRWARSGRTGLSPRQPRSAPPSRPRWRQADWIAPQPTRCSPPPASPQCARAGPCGRRGCPTGRWRCCG